jgi:DivIVA domain-containing protein
MGEFFLLLIVALVVGAIVFGVAVLITGDDEGIEGHEPDGRAIPLPSTRPLGEGDVTQLRFDTVVRGYRMSQVDAALRRAAYDIGYKEELIQVLEAEVNALRDGREEDAESFRQAREAAISGANAGGSARVAGDPESPDAATDTPDGAPVVVPAADDEGDSDVPAADVISNGKPESKSPVAQ